MGAAAQPPSIKIAAQLRRTCFPAIYMSRQIGQFFFFIGVILLVIFFASDQSENTAWGYFISGAALIALGGYLMWRNRRTDLENNRFRAYRKMRDRPKKVKKKIEE